MESFFCASLQVDLEARGPLVGGCTAAVGNNRVRLHRKDGWYVKQVFKETAFFFTPPRLKSFGLGFSRCAYLHILSLLLASGLFLSGLQLFPSPAFASFDFGEVYIDGIGLKYAYAVAVSPDGSHVYAAGKTDNKCMAVFKRDSATGRLSYVQTLRNGFDNVDGLDGVSSISVSPDGAHVYATGYYSDTVAVFSRHSDTGQLVFVQVVRDDVAGVNGLNGARSIAVSPLGNHLYVAGMYDNAVAVFSRDSSTGELTFKEALGDLSQAYTVTVSPEGSHVYATEYSSDSVTVFSRDNSSGLLTFVQEYRNGSNSISGLDGPKGIDLSTDGKSVYVSGNNSNTVVVFSRNVNSGELTFVEVQTKGIDGVDGLYRAYGLVVSQDDAHVYVIGCYDDAVAIFHRNSATGELTFAQMLKNGIGGVAGIPSPYNIIESPDGKFVYITDYTSNAVATFSRDSSSGLLSFVEVFKDSDGGVDGLTQVQKVTVSLDGKHVYTAGYMESAVSLFERNTSTGRLTFIEAIKDTVSLDRARAITVSPNGEYVYAAGYDTMVAFNRDDLTGKLSVEEEFKDGDGDNDGLENISDIAVSPDEMHVYVTSSGYGGSAPGDNALTVFGWDSGKNLLSFKQVIKDTDTGMDGLYGAASVTVSPDGHHVYATGKYDAAVVVFSRAPDTGELTFLQLIKDSDPNMDGLGNASSVVVSPDNKHVYVTGQADDAIVTFNRDIDTGLLSLSSVITNSDITDDCLDGAESARITPDGTRLFIAASSSRYAGGVRGGVTAFTRDPNTGGLSFEKVITAYDDGIPSLDQVRFIALSPDNGHLYSAASPANAVAVFDLDYDQDGTPNNLDDDDDGDNVLDVNDHFPADPLEWEDTDGDGTGNNADTNDDNDGYLDGEDAFPLDPLEWEDTDGDRTGNNADTDDDNDGVEDDADAFQLDPSEWKDTDGDGTGDNADTDDDNDGVDDDVEAAAPGNGDGNADGTQDILQDNVTSLTAHESTEYITLATVSGTTLADCQASGIAAVSDEAPENADFSYGLVNFTINGLTPGAATTAMIYLPEGTEPKTYYKYGRTPDNSVNHWYEFLYDGTTGAEINGNVITLHFVDGKRGDNDLIENGVVVDPGGPSFSADDTKPTGGGGCFINSLAP